MPTEQSVADALTIDDLDVLIEAVEAWENKNETGEIMGDLMTALIVKKDDPSYDKVMAESTERKRKAADEKRGRKERSILLRAKLIGLLDTRRATLMVADVVQS